MQMRAAVQTGKGSGIGVEIQNIPRPSPGPTEILTRNHCAALNRADLGIAAGGQHGSVGGAGTILGLEWAGEVIAIGAEVTRFKPGDRVICSGSGGYAEYAVADHRRVFPMPLGNMSYAEGATLPVALRTMHDAIVTNGALAAGQDILIHGASSGVGMMGLQIAREMGARRVLGSSTRADKLTRLSPFGMTHGIDIGQPDWADQVLDATEGRGVDLVIDMVSGSGINETLRATAICGRIVNVGRLGGAQANFNFDLHALRRISYIGVTFRTRSVAEVGRISELTEADLWAPLKDGRLRLPIDRIMPLDDVALALGEMATNQHFGKIVLDCT